MIINTGGRTDTVQYYTPWLLKRFEEGYVLSRNPMFPDKVNRYDLTPEKVDCVLFCSKNYKPILNDLHKIMDRFNTYFFYTITAYGKDIEPNVPDIDESISTLKQLSSLVGKQRLVWRYDPILLTPNYSIKTHLSTFERMTAEIAPYVDRCVFSFVEMYDKVPFNMPDLIPLKTDDKLSLAEGLGRIARVHGMRIQTCATTEDYSQYGIDGCGCVTLEALGRANGVLFKDMKHIGIRKNCRCIESRDIGWYDTCPNGCSYCYANRDPKSASENYRKHDPDSPLLFGSLKDTDEVVQGSQISFLKRPLNVRTLDEF